MPRLSETPFVHPTAEVENATLGRYTEIERTRFQDATLGDYSYVMQDCGVWCAEIGKSPTSPPPCASTPPIT